VTTAVVTIAHGRHQHLTAQRRSLDAGTQRPDHYVVVAMDDEWIADWAPGRDLVPYVVEVPMDPRGLPLAAARNAGVRAAVALGADVVIGLDVDCLVAADLVAGYETAVLEEPGTLWSGPVTYLAPPAGGGYDLARLEEEDSPHPARPAPARGMHVGGGHPDLFWSLSYALHRDAWLRIGGFDEEYVGYGAEDTDFGHRAAAVGIELSWTGSARAYHQYHGTESPPVHHLDDILRNGEIFHGRWGRWPMTGWLESFEELGLVTRTGTGWSAVRAGPVRGS